MVFKTLVACMDKLAIHPIDALWASMGIEETTHARRGYRWALNPAGSWDSGLGVWGHWPASWSSQKHFVQIMEVFALLMNNVLNYDESISDQFRVQGFFDGCPA